MKTRLLTLVAALAATASMAQTNQVLSRNAVGYEKITVRNNNFELTRLDFVNLGGSAYTVTNLIGDQLPVGSAAFIYNNAEGTWLSEGRTRGGWLPGTNKIVRGQAVFLNVPSSAPSNSYSVFYMGEVPDSVTAPTTTISNIEVFKGLGYPYPVAMQWTNTTLGATAPTGAGLFTWDAGITSYVSYARTRGGWGAATNLVIQPGQGFFYTLPAGTTQTWVEVKPYTWP